MLSLLMTTSIALTLAVFERRLENPGIPRSTTAGGRYEGQKHHEDHLPTN